MSCDAKNIIYVIKCKGCDEEYIGETGDTLRHRLTVHRQQIRDARVRILYVSNHIANCARIQPVKFSILPLYKMQTDCVSARKIKEKHFIGLFKPKLNIICSSVCLVLRLKRLLLGSLPSPDWLAWHSEVLWIPKPFSFLERLACKRLYSLLLCWLEVSGGSWTHSIWCFTCVHGCYIPLHQYTSQRWYKGMRGSMGWKGYKRPSYTNSGETSHTSSEV